MPHIGYKKKHTPWNKGLKNSTGTYWLGRSRPEVKEWLSPFSKGHIPWNKGKQNLYSENTRSRMSAAAKHRVGSNASNWKGGLPNCSDCGKEVWYYSKRCQQCRIKFMHSQRGPLARTWKGGVTPVVLAIRHCQAYRRWRRSIFERDDYTCVLCGARGSGDLNADHFPVTFAEIVYSNKIRTLEQAIRCEQFWNINNGRTLCVPCHLKTPTHAHRRRP